MRELSAPQINNQPWCIHAVPEKDNFEVKTSVVHYLPKFVGLSREVAMRYLKEFDGVCNTLRPYATSKERFKL